MFEMNRLGMIIDIAESSIGTMKEVLILSRAPVIFSHSAARAVCNNEKNIPDDVLKLVVSYLELSIKDQLLKSYKT